MQATPSKKHSLSLEGAFYILMYTVALRGEEIPLIELAGITKHWDMGLNHEIPHIVVALIGWFKNELGESHHLMSVLCETPVGLLPKKWVERGLLGYTSLGISNGYMFRNQNGTKLKPSTFEPSFHYRIEQIKYCCPHMISPETDAPEEYGVSRSFRRGATSEATNRGASAETMKLIG
jgi:hypothetical protein